MEKNINDEQNESNNNIATNQETETENNKNINLQNANYIENPLEELKSLSGAVVYFGIPCCCPLCTICTCPLLCIGGMGCCENNYRYSVISIKNGRYDYLFKNTVTIDCCHICPHNPLRRLKSGKNYVINSYSQILSDDSGKLICKMNLINNCSCCTSCNSMDLEVKTMPDNNLIGLIKFEPCHKECCCGGCKCKNCSDCCYDFYYCYDILSPNGGLIYTIYFRKCCIQCPCCPEGECDSIQFDIKDPNFIKVGSIRGDKTCCNLLGCSKNNYSYNIKFPKDATVENKLCLINAVMAFDLQHIVNI